MIESVLKIISRLFKKNREQKIDRMGELVELCKNNSKEAYDKLWNDEELVKTYLEPARIESYMVIVQYVLRQSFGNRILDIGFGSGDFLRCLIEEAPHRSFEIYGLDYSKSAVRRVKKIIPKGKFITGDIYDLPHTNDFFDQVFCIQTLEHLKHPGKALTEMDRVCKPDGMILITVPNGEIDNYEGHLNFWNEAEFKDFLSPRKLIDFFFCNENRAFMASMKPLKVK